jgi:formylglycine-generating enzyme required for sulfatase activity
MAGGPATPGRPDSAAGKEPREAAFADAVCAIQMVWVPGGAFRMGDLFEEGIENERPVREVTLDGFYMACHCVTQAQWKQLSADNPSHHQGERLPVEQITWEQACRFAERLTDAHQGRCRFALPSEAQWEYAARGGGKSQRYAGGDSPEPLAWYAENSQGRTQPVGTKAPNALGLFDMSGNVWEWCRDTYLENAYQRHPDRNPVIEEPGPDRVIRGGSFHLDAWSVRCARRIGFAADFVGPGLGFRLVMQPVEALTARPAKAAV